MAIENHHLLELPATAAWRHCGLRDGFEVAYFATGSAEGTTQIWGSSVAVEGTASYTVSYRVVVDENWKTREASIETRTRGATWVMELVRDEHGTWFVDGEERADLSACTDIDLEASVVTNTIPVHRLSAISGPHEVRAVYVRATERRVEVLDQTYSFPMVGASSFACAYTAPQFEYSADLRYDASGLIVEYPDLATRVDSVHGDIQ
ncbi:hypothetical protein CH294_05865 [Rhodococcus sp. 14-2483-1-1]|uniref:putative glycolipid-binding domain-containing protein n=1 Tax=Rhodococcus sp. 14-2483-1-1 TaxID=2023148 RepID=UPI000B9BDA04|nr:putative glycolipid-binding domain-containing protein [Rhodococcus sp. 14-2483-1-1]OZF39755.1 hypothetical protein CH294_05865 [Rhodococcus sp. 14-2483-1-1]